MSVLVEAHRLSVHPLLQLLVGPRLPRHQKKRRRRRKQKKSQTTTWYVFNVIFVLPGADTRSQGFGLFD
jgi:hypothetical protein